ncbi:hypothetical protein MGN70_010111 [Eutypa lata]|nr:hypothetical protein MGN70_010111 [Eutypa lata]
MVKRLPQADWILAIDEAGQIAEQGTFPDLNVPGNYVYGLKIKLNEQSQETNQGESVHEFVERAEGKQTSTRVSDGSRQTGDWATYKYYSRTLGLMSIMLFLSAIAVNETASGMQSVWLNWWAQSNERGEDPKTGYWLGIFAGLSVLDAAGMIAAIAFLWIHMIPKSGNSLHRIILAAVMRAPMSFFSETETGVLVNRFSQDLRLADLTLPGAIINCAFQLGSCLVVVALAVTAVGYFAALLPLVIGVLYLIQRFYLRTSRQLRLLELEANAPLYSHFIESLNGLVTIRAFGWTESYATKNRKLLDESQKPFYLLLCVQRWLVLVLDLVVAGLAVLLMGMTVALRSSIDAGLLGIALVQMMSLSHALTHLVQSWTLLETSLGAIARIKDFSENTPSESLPDESDAPDPEWPSQGVLSFEGVSASYGDSKAPVLHDLTFSVQGGQKIGIVGRTGSGKSSSTLAILRMINLTSGRIVLDNIDLASLKGSVVRERVICLTQDPFLFPSSIRLNVDPESRCTDEAIVVAFEKVKLWGVLQEKTRNGQSGIASILDTPMDTDFLSHGQRQLFCLARALLKPGKVLILDEPTSSVDARTDTQMQEVIRSEFADHTIVMIAHRLSTLVDFDRVIVLDSGRLVESGKPSELLKDQSSIFSKLHRGSSQSMM